MKYFTFLFIIALQTVVGFSQKSNLTNNIFKSIKIFYVDSLTEKGHSIIRELEYIGDEPYQSKPMAFDIVVNINDSLLNGTVEIILQEQFVPDTNLINKCESCDDFIDIPFWGIYQVLNTFYYKNKIEKSIEIKNTNYKTTYFLDTRMYFKYGFRIIVIYYPADKESKIESIKKEYFYN